MSTDSKLTGQVPKRGAPPGGEGAVGPLGDTFIMNKIRARDKMYTLIGTLLG
jgi:hypothetical protein